jgi:hypothetical protein
MKEKHDLIIWDMIPLEIKANYRNNKDRIQIINVAEYVSASASRIYVFFLKNSKHHYDKVLLI